MENFISDTEFNIKQKIQCRIIFCIALGGRGWVYISVSSVTAAIGSALTASHLEKRQVTKRSWPFRSVPRLGSACPPSGPAPWDHRPCNRGGLPAGQALRMCTFPVGASLLAMVANDNACCLNERSVWPSIASRLAPTGIVGGHDMGVHRR